MVIDRLLVAIGTGEDERADELTGVAMDLARPGETTVYLLHVFQQTEYDELAEEMDFDPTAGDLTPDELAARHRSVANAGERLAASDFEYEVRGVIGGNTADQVLRIAAENDVDHLVVGGSNRSPTGKAMFGDHAQQILLRSSCPVTYVRRNVATE